MGHFPCWRRRILYHFSLFPLFFAGFVAALDTRDFYPPMWGEGKQFVDAFQPFGEPLNVRMYVGCDEDDATESLFR